MYKRQGDGAAPLAVGAETEVANAADLSLFLALIEFCDALLPTVDRSHLIHHAHLLSVDLVDLAGAYPHVSGFYKLVRIVVDVCETCGYFDGGSGDG